MLIASHEISALVEFSIQIPWSILIAACVLPLAVLAAWLRFRIREIRIRRRYREPRVIGRIIWPGPR